MVDQGREWGRKGATLGEKSACAEFGLTHDEIVEAINAGKLQYRISSMHGYPWVRLLRREVEGLVGTLRGERYLKQKLAKAELARVDLELKRLRTEVTALEERRSNLLADLKA